MSVPGFDAVASPARASTRVQRAAQIRAFTGKDSKLTQPVLIVGQP